MDYRGLGNGGQTGRYKNSLRHTDLGMNAKDDIDAVDSHVFRQPWQVTGGKHERRQDVAASIHTRRTIKDIESSPL